MHTTSRQGVRPVYRSQQCPLGQHKLGDKAYVKRTIKAPKPFVGSLDTDREQSFAVTQTVVHLLVRGLSGVCSRHTGLLKQV